MERLIRLALARLCLALACLCNLITGVLLRASVALSTLGQTLLRRF
jgi:hypothetical protein